MKILLVVILQFILLMEQSFSIMLAFRVFSGQFLAILMFLLIIF